MRKWMFHKQLEICMVILIIAILAVLQIKSYMPMIGIAKIVHSAGATFQRAKMDDIFFRAYHGEWPKDNEQASRFGWHDEYIINDDAFKDIQLKDGAITLKYNEFFPEKVITIRPAVPSNDPLGPIIWVCGDSRAADDWLVFGDDLTNIEKRYIHSYMK